MMKISATINHISESSLQSSPAIQAFLNYLRYTRDPEEFLTADIVTEFFYDALQYTHWEQNKLQLGTDVLNVLSQLEKSSDIEFSLNDINWPNDIQIVELQSTKNFYESTQAYLLHEYKSSDKFRLFDDQGKKIIAVIMNEDDSIDLRSFDKKFTIRNGHLEPLRRDVILSYMSDLEFNPLRMQKIELAPYVSVLFKTAGGGALSGYMIRGYLFQKMNDFTEQNLQSIPKLFYAVKRAEQFFVSRKTDPYYLYITDTVEKVTRMGKMGDLKAAAQASDIFAHASAALENVYLNDKLLQLLIKELQNSLNIPENSKEFQNGRKPIISKSATQ